MGSHYPGRGGRGDAPVPLVRVAPNRVTVSTRKFPGLMRPHGGSVAVETPGRQADMKPTK